MEAVQGAVAYHIRGIPEAQTSGGHQNGRIVPVFIIRYTHHPFCLHFLCAVDISRIYLDIDDRRPVECVQSPYLQNVIIYVNQVDHADRDRVRAIGRTDSKYPFLRGCPGRDCPEDSTICPVKPAENPEMLLPFNLPESRAVFFFDPDLGYGLGEPSLPGSIAFFFVGGADIADGMESNGCGCHE